MSRYQKRQEAARARCNELINSNDVRDMIAVERLLSYILDKETPEPEKAASVSLTSLIACRLSEADAKRLFFFAKALEEK